MTTNEMGSVGDPWNKEVYCRSSYPNSARSTETFATSFSLNRLQDRGRFFVSSSDIIYKGQVVGEHNRDNDLEVNLIKGKHLTNMRKSGSDDAIKISPKIEFSLEESMEYIKEDEYLEITPISLRMRKI